MNALLTLLFVSLCGTAHAIRLPLVAREVPSGFRSFFSEPASRLGKVRVDQNIENERDVVYATTITIGGVETPIQLDTGSSDLWFQAPGPAMPKFTNTTKIGTNLTYGIGFAEGQVQFADVEFGSHTVKNQAVLNVTRAVDLGAIKSNGINGIMGLGFDVGSAITVKLGELWGTDGAKKGLTFMSNIFAQNKTTPNMFSVLLGRAYDRDGPEDGAFTIGEYVEGYEEIAHQPKLYRTPAQLGSNITQIPRWTVQLDGMTVNGKAFQFNKSSVPEAAPGKQVVLLDTGYTYSQLPKAAVDFIYSGIPGAHFNASNGYWQVPCNATTKLSFQFKGMDVPIDPLDITGVKTIGNDTVCINSYRTFNLPPGAAAGLDFILGDSFLKNVYISYDFGDATLSETTNGLPFVQMLPTTDLKAATEDYQTVRDRQIRKNDQKIKESGGIALENTPTEEIAIAPASGPSLGDLNKSLGNLGKRRRAQMEAIPVPVPVPVNSAAEVPKVVFATVHEQQQVPVPVPVVRVHHRIMQCVHVIHKHFGAVAVALLAGTFGIVFMMALVAAALGIRMLVRRRWAVDGYESLEEAKGEIVFQVDEQFYDNATNGLTPPRYA